VQGGAKVVDGITYDRANPLGNVGRSGLQSPDMFKGFALVLVGETMGVRIDEPFNLTIERLEVLVRPCYLSLDTRGGSCHDRSEPTESANAKGARDTRSQARGLRGHTEQ